MKIETYKHNSIIGTTGNSITLQEERYINICLGKVYKRDLLDKDTWYSIDVKEYAEQSGLTLSNSYKELRKVASLLREAKVVIAKGGDNSIEVGWVYSILFNPVEFTLAVKWHEDIIPFISGFTKGNYTTLHESVVKLRSINSYRLYEVVKREAYKKEFTIEYETLKDMLGVSYKEFGLFSLRLLEPCHAEIVTKTDLRYSYRANKTGRKVTSITFFGVNLEKLGDSMEEREKRDRQMRLYGKVLEV